MTRIYHVMKKEFIQTFRDKRMLGIIFIAPIFQLLIFGYAITTDIKNINLGMIDRDHSRESRAVVDALMGSGYYTFVGDLENDQGLKDAIHTGQIDMAIVIPEDYSRRINRFEQSDLQAIFDASDSNFAMIAGNYSTRIISSLASEMLFEQIEAIRATAASMGKIVPAQFPTLTPKTRVWYNPELKSAYYMVPGIICMLLLVVTMLLTGLAITREREIGTIEQVIVSPIKSWELILGKLAPFAILGFIDVALIVVVGTWHFGVPIRGSIALLFLASGLFLFSTLGLGLFFSSISATQQQAVFVVFMFLMPSILLSGLMFPIANMPEPIQYLTYLNPLRYFLVVVRGIFLKGNGIDVLWPQLLAMLVFGVVIFSIASARFSKRLS